MSRRRRLLPELELPPILSAAIAEYIGPRKLAKLSQLQRSQLMRAAHDLGSTVAEILDPEGSPLLSTSRVRVAGMPAAFTDEDVQQLARRLLDGERPAEHDVTPGAEADRGEPAGPDE